MTRPRTSLFALWSLAFANGVAVIVVCMIRVDRPVADLVHARMRQTPLFDWTARVLGSLHVVLKFLIGRSQVYPPWIERREYGTGLPT